MGLYIDFYLRAGLYNDVASDLPFLHTLYHDCLAFDNYDAVGCRKCSFLILSGKGVIFGLGKGNIDLFCGNLLLTDVIFCKVSVGGSREQGAKAFNELHVT